MIVGKLPCAWLAHTSQQPAGSALASVPTDGPIEISKADGLCACQRGDSGPLVRAYVALYCRPFDKPLSICAVGALRQCELLDKKKREKNVPSEQFAFLRNIGECIYINIYIHTRASNLGGHKL